MNQEKIGKFIAELRKEKKLTQKDLAEKIGVTDRAISKWENGRGMPDVSFLRVLCENLDISLNELLSGEKISEEDKISRLEDNYISVIDSKKKLQNDVAGYLILKLVGFFLFFIGYCFLDADSILISIIIFLGFVFIMACSFKLVNSWNKTSKIIYLLVIFLMIFCGYSYIEYQYVDDALLTHPRFYYSKKVSGNCTIYKTPFYSCVRNKNWNIDSKDKRVTCDILNDLNLNKTDEDEYISKYCDVNYDYRKDCENFNCEFFENNK